MKKTNKVQRAPSSPKPLKSHLFDSFNRRIHLRLKVIDVELFEVAKHDATRTTRHGAAPTLEGLAVVLREIHAALFHFDENHGFPDVIGKAGAAAALRGFANAELRLAADIE